MTHQRQAQLQTPRTSQSTSPLRSILIASGAALVLLGGCGGEEKPKPRVQEEPEVEIQRAPAPPPVTPISELMAQYGIDDRVRLMEQDAPGTDQERIAVLTFFNSMLVQQDEFAKMLSSEDQREFNTMMMQADAISEALGEVSEVRLQCGASPDFKPAVVAIIETYDGWHPQLWTYTISSSGMNALPPVFTSGPTPLSVMSKLSGGGQVQRWYELLDEELTIANRPEEATEDLKVDLRNEVDNVNQSSGSGAPLGPGGTPGRVRPKNDRKLDAPSFSPTK